MRPPKGCLIVFTKLRCLHLSPVVCTGLYPACLLTWLHSPSGLRFYWARITGFWIFMPPGVGHVNTLLQSLRSWLEWVVFFFFLHNDSVNITRNYQWKTKEWLKWCFMCGWQILKGKVRAGKIDCQAHQHTCQTAGISSYPTVRFYPYLGTQRVRPRPPTTPTQSSTYTVIVQ